VPAPTHAVVGHVIPQACPMAGSWRVDPHERVAPGAAIAFNALLRCIGCSGTTVEHWHDRHLCAFVVPQPGKLSAARTDRLGLDRNAEWLFVLRHEWKYRCIQVVSWSGNSVRSGMPASRNRSWRRNAKHHWSGPLISVSTAADTGPARTRAAGPAVYCIRVTDGAAGQYFPTETVLQALSGALLSTQPPAQAGTESHEARRDLGPAWVYSGIRYGVDDGQIPPIMNAKPCINPTIRILRLSGLEGVPGSTAPMIPSGGR
jgi:hypothetical protein